MRCVPILLTSLVFAGCASGSCNETNAIPLAAPLQAVSPCPLQAASPCATMTAPAAYAALPGAEVGVVYSIDGASYVRAGFAVPAGWVACGTQFIADVGQAFAKGLVCLGNSFTPPVMPTARYVMVQRVQRTAAGPCGR